MNAVFEQVVIDVSKVRTVANVLDDMFIGLYPSIPERERFEDLQNMVGILLSLVEGIEKNLEHLEIELSHVQDPKIE